MVEPVTTAALITAAATAAKGGMDAHGNSQSRASQKRARKEDKRRTRAEMLLEMLRQNLESSQSTRASQNEMAATRAKSYQDKASGFIKALRG